MKNVILISGKMRSGKDYSALVLKTILEDRGYRVGILHFGDALKMVSSSLYGWSGEKDEVGRHILQYVGTEIGRAHNPNIWTNIVNLILQVIYDDFDFIIIPDTRFKNEADYHFVVPSYKIRIIGEAPDNTDPATQHPSETNLDNYKNFDMYINNYPHLSITCFTILFRKLFRDLGV